MPLDVDVFGRGIYSPRQAARLIGTSSQNVLRWTRGSGPTEPLWHAYYQPLDDTTELSFADLVELRVVRAFRRQGISLQSIRFAISYAQNAFGIERPLATSRFKTDGREILMAATESDENYVSLSKKRPGQKVFTEIIKQSLSDLEYENGEAARWRPNGYQNIVVDPGRLFGEPILDEYGVSSKTLHDEFQSSRNVRYLSAIYEVPQSIVREGIGFEESLLKAQRSDGESTI